MVGLKLEGHPQKGHPIYRNSQIILLKSPVWGYRAAYALVVVFVMVSGLLGSLLKGFEVPETGLWNPFERDLGPFVEGVRGCWKPGLELI